MSQPNRFREVADWADLETPWRMLAYFNLYRIALAGLFAALGVDGELPRPFGDTDPHLFSVTAVIYFLFAVLLHASVRMRLATINRQVLMQVGVDILALTLLLYASGGVTSGFGILIVVSVAGASLAASGYLVMFLAANAAIAVLVATLVSRSTYLAPAEDLPQAGFLGMAFFAAAALGYGLAERARRGEAIAAQQAQDIAALSQLNEAIVQRLRSGVVVVSPDEEVVLMNESAAHLLKVAAPAAQTPLAAVDAVLGQHYRSWRETGFTSALPLRSANGDSEFLLACTRLGEDEDSPGLVFLDDASETQQRVQQLKLMSLGRLTASIAHEVRNPLGAISHASQLLGESSELDCADRRLIEIIGDHCRRVNEIIENVMRIGRREAVFSESFDLGGWLEAFVAEYRGQHDMAEEAVVLEPLGARSVPVRMDRSQLRQVVVNLVDNGCRHAEGLPKVTLAWGQQADTERPYLEIRDSGPGMEDSTAAHIFEPFFTGSSGTGLGLYIARELCENNQASLTLVAHGASGCCFRILFAHPDRRQFTE